MSGLTPTNLSSGVSVSPFTIRLPKTHASPLSGSGAAVGATLNDGANELSGAGAGVSTKSGTGTSAGASS